MKIESQVGKEYSLIIGIDPGLKGGIAMIQGAELKGLYPMPLIKKNNKQVLDLEDLKSLLQNMKDEYIPIVYLEECWAHGPQNFRYARKKSPQSMFTFGKGFGELIGLLVGLNIPYKIVPPNKWKIKLKITGREKTKEDSIIKIKEFFPDVNLKSSSRSKIDHDGMAESLLIAIYGGLEEWT